MAALAVVALVTAAFAQPPGGPAGGPPNGGRPPHDPLRAALDANHDHEIDAEEMKNAPAALAMLDKNGDGKVDREEFRPPLPPGMQGPPEGRPRGEFEGDRGPRRGPPPEGDVAGRRPPRDGEGPPPGGGPDGRPPREGRGPSPEQFIERAMGFDADGDGKLDRSELEKFATEMRQRRGGPGGDRGPDRGGPPGGDRPERPRRPE